MKRTLVIKAYLPEDSTAVYGIVELDDHAVNAIKERYSQLNLLIDTWGDRAPDSLVWEDGHCFFVDCEKIHEFLAKHLTSREAFAKHMPSLNFDERFDKERPFDVEDLAMHINELFTDYVDFDDEGYLTFVDIPDYTGKQENVHYVHLHAGKNGVWWQGSEDDTGEPYESASIPMFAITGE
jgi:hypothetical protein